MRCGHEARPAGHEHAVDALHAGARLRLDECVAVLIHRVARGIRDRARLERARAIVTRSDETAAATIARAGRAADESGA